MILSFGTNLYWANKVENACISAGIFTRVWKAPWLYDVYRSEDTPKVKIFEIFGNGNAVDKFEAKKKDLASELGIVIHDIAELGSQHVLIRFTKDKKGKVRGKNRLDKDF